MLRDKNTFGEMSFYCLCSFAMIGISLLYGNVFRIPQIMDSAKATMILIEAAAYIAGILLFSNRRNIVTVITVGLMPSLAFFMLSYHHIAGMRIAVSLAVGMLLSAAYAYLQITMGKGKGRKKQRLIILGAVNLIIVSMTCSLLIPIGEYNVPKQIENTFNDEYEYTSWREENSLDYNMESASRLDDSIWPTLDSHEKIETLETIMVVETNYLGIKQPNIEYKDLGGSVLGEADCRNNTVMLNPRILWEESSEMAVTALVHELFHLYSRKCVRVYDELDKQDRGLLLFRPFEEMSQDYQHYESGKDGHFEEYAGQTCEVLAREYSEESYKEISERVREYLEDSEASKS